MWRVISQTLINVFNIKLNESCNNIDDFSNWLKFYNNSDNEVLKDRIHLVEVCNREVYLNLFETS